MVGLIAGGIVCVVLGLAIGFRPLSTATLPHAADLSCGSALAPIDHKVTSFVVPGYQPVPRHFKIRSCSDVRHVSLVLTIILCIAGILLLAGAMTLSLRRHIRPLQSN